jgi:hypothetical protein
MEREEGGSPASLQQGPGGRNRWRRALRVLEAGQEAAANQVHVLRRRARSAGAWFRTRPESTKVSPLGWVIQLTGATAVLMGLHSIYPPLAFLVGGVGAILIGEKA